MLYILIVYYSWFLGLCAWIATRKRGRSKAGLVLILLAAVLQSGAHALHVLESLRLRGEPV